MSALVKRARRPSRSYSGVERTSKLRSKTSPGPNHLEARARSVDASLLRTPSPTPTEVPRPSEMSPKIWSTGHDERRCLSTPRSASGTCSLSARGPTAPVTASSAGDLAAPRRHGRRSPKLKHGRARRALPYRHLRTPAVRRLRPDSQRGPLTAIAVATRRRSSTLMEGDGARQCDLRSHHRRSEAGELSGGASGGSQGG